jgi:hypothetical protein
LTRQGGRETKTDEAGEEHWQERSRDGRETGWMQAQNPKSTKSKEKVNPKNGPPP